MEADAPCERQQPLPLHFRVPRPLTCHFRSVQAPLGAQCQPGAASDRPSAGPLPSCPPLWSRQGRAGNPNALSGPRCTARKLGGWAPAASGGGAQGCWPVAGCHPLQASQTRVPPSPEMSASRVRRPPTRQLCSSPASPHSRCCGAGGQSGASPIARQAWALNRGVCTLLSNEGRLAAMFAQSCWVGIQKSDLLPSTGAALARPACAANRPSSGRWKGAARAAPPASARSRQPFCTHLIPPAHLEDGGLARAGANCWLLLGCCLEKPFSGDHCCVCSRRRTAATAAAAAASSPPPPT